ncbi:hypothetical protein CBM2637_U10002 [Cupriavidus taiwanensis]|nr:hypothetical protein CBM2637_U10002 [Cupriavidus taiwanensis]
MPGPIHRLADRHHIRILRRLPDEIDHRRKRLERMVQQDVAIAHGAEDIGLVPQRLGQARPERRVFQVRPVDLVRHLHQADQVDRTVDREHLGGCEAKLLLQERGHGARAVVGHLEPHRIAEVPVRQFALQRLAQVLDLFLVDKQLAVAGNPELVAAAHRHAAEQLADVGMQDRRQEHEAVFASGNLRWQRDHARQRPGRLHNGIAGAAAERILALELNGEVQALVQHARKRMRRIQPDWRQDRHQLGKEELANPVLLRGIPRWPPQEANLLLGHGGNQHVIEQPVLLTDQLAHALVDRGVNGLRRQPVRADHRRRQHALLLQPRHADLIELIQVAAEGAQRTQALEQRHGRIGRLLQDPLKERQLAEFAVDIERIAVGHGGRIRQVARLALPARGRRLVMHNAGFVFHDAVPREAVFRF